jgi:hypothetical protein
LFFSVEIFFHIYFFPGFCSDNVNFSGSSYLQRNGVSNAVCLDFLFSIILFCFPNAHVDGRVDSLTRILDAFFTLGPEVVGISLLLLTLSLLAKKQAIVARVVADLHPHYQSLVISNSRRRGVGLFTTCCSLGSRIEGFRFGRHKELDLAKRRKKGANKVRRQTAIRWKRKGCNEKWTFLPF